VAKRTMGKSREKEKYERGEKNEEKVGEYVPVAAVRLPGEGSP